MLVLSSFREKDQYAEGKPLYGLLSATTFPGRENTTYITEEIDFLLSEAQGQDFNKAICNLEIYLIISKCVCLETSCTIVKIVLPCSNELFIESQGKNFSAHHKIVCLILKIIVILQLATVVTSKKTVKIIFFRNFWCQILQTS